MTGNKGESAVTDYIKITLLCCKCAFNISPGKILLSGKNRIQIMAFEYGKPP